MSRTFPIAIKELLLALPQTNETRAHGAPTFKVAGKTFAHIAINHGGDGRYALWLRVPDGAQADFVAQDPTVYFVPPYLGPSGWLGLDAGTGITWPEICARVFEAWHNTAPAALAGQIAQAPDIDPPSQRLLPEEIDPMLRPRAKELLSELSSHCARFPEAFLDNASGHPTCMAGRKAFVRIQHQDGRLALLFWVGVEQQAFYEDDPRYFIPLYWGSNGWLGLDVEEATWWEEIENLMEQSYRHFALKRMLKALDAED